MKTLTLYLSGAIRDNHPEDIGWREEVIAALHGYPVCILNPLGGKVHHPDGSWTVSGIPSKASVIVAHDFWAVDHSDIIVTNFRALSQKYPNIGTLIEFGRGTARGCLMYSIIDPDYTGHENTKMFQLHPFIELNSAAIFNTVAECVTFLRSHLQVLSGFDPHFKGDGAPSGLNPFYGAANK